MSESEEGVYVGGPFFCASSGEYTHAREYSSLSVARSLPPSRSLSLSLLLAIESRRAGDAGGVWAAGAGE